MINNSEKILKIIDDLQGDDRLIASPKVCNGIMEIREIIEASNSEKPKYTELSPVIVAVELSPVDMTRALNWHSTISRLIQAGYVICRKENV